MHGVYGRVLNIDLSNRSFLIETLPSEVCESYLGGKGLATRLLLDRNPAGVDPLSADNHLIFATGPFCQNRVWGGSRYGVFTKSPLTGFYLESYSGGKAPEAIDSAGYDAIVIRGIAEGPTVLAVHPDGCDFHDAGDLWGMETYQAEDEAKARFAPDKEGYGRPGAVVIGPAGETGVRFACIKNDRWRSAGRAGAGAVMGSKKIKAIVFRGDRKRTVSDPDGLASYTKAFVQENKDHPGAVAYKNRGTTMMVAVMNNAQAFPNRYWTSGVMEGWEKISGDTLHEEHEVKPSACLKCFMACGRKTTITKGRRQGLVIEGPEYETIYAFGGLCLIDDLGEIAYLNDLCDRLGIDTITAGNLCGFAIEAARRGKIDYPIDYGDADAVADLVQKIGRQEGVGEVLAQGIIAAAREWGMEDVAVHVKGMEPAGYEPRVLKGMGLAYATSDRGACHLRTTFYKPELAGLIAADTVEGKAEMLIDYEDRLILFDCMVLCRFYRDIYPWEEFEKLVPLVTGLDASKESLQARAAAVADMTREFNLREGLKPEHDRLPKRLFEEALPTGHRLVEEEFNRLLQDYYRIRGWS